MICHSNSTTAFDFWIRNRYRIAAHLSRSINQSINLIFNVA